jgi:hypothetical protein
LIVPLMRQCAGTVAVAATGVTEVMAVFGTGIPATGNDAALHASAGVLARATRSVATECPWLFVANSSNVLMPGTRPPTVPVLTPGWLSVNAVVTSLPLSRTTARCTRAVESALILIATLSAEVKIGSGVFRLRIA